MFSTPLKQPQNPGANSEAVFYDNAPRGLDVIAWKASKPREEQRVIIAFFVDQEVVVKHDWYAPGSSNPRTLNGDGDGHTVAASTPFCRDYRLRPGRNRIYMETGTECTVFEVAAEMSPDQTMGDFA